LEQSLAELTKHLEETKVAKRRAQQAMEAAGKVQEDLQKSVVFVQRLDSSALVRQFFLRLNVLHKNINKKNLNIFNRV
jgi:archaellum component FlaD/FlaE